MRVTATGVVSSAVNDAVRHEFRARSDLTDVFKSMKRRSTTVFEAAAEAVHCDYSRLGLQNKVLSVIAAQSSVATDGLGCGSGAVPALSCVGPRLQSAHEPPRLHTGTERFAAAPVRHLHGLRPTG